MHFYKLFELKCVSAVCVHNHPIMIQISFLSTKIFTPLSYRAVCLCDVTQTEAPPTIVDWQTALVSYLRPALSELSSVALPPEQMKTKMSPKGLRCFVVGCNNEHSSSHLLPLSGWFWRECALDLPKCVYVPLNHSWSSFIYRNS